MFMLPDTWAPAGATPIGSVRDLLALGRTHLARGLSPSGRRVLSHESIARMRSVSHDMGTPNISPLALGWSLVPFGGVIALSHSGASPGGVAILVVVPGQDLVFAAFGNDVRGSHSTTASCSGCSASTSMSKCRTSSPTLRPSTI
jgi:hypothetical protein